MLEMYKHCPFQPDEKGDTMNYQYAVGYASKRGNIISITEVTSIRSKAEEDLRDLISDEEGADYFVISRPTPVWTRD